MSRYRSMAMRRLRQHIVFGVLRLMVGIVLGTLGGILLFLAVQGIGAISWEFLTEYPRNSMTEGGIFPAIVGTLALTVGALLVSLPLSVATAIYLTEYAKEGRLVRFVRLGIANLAGVPSVVFGLFGLAVFVTLFGMGVSLAAGSLTLGLLIMPTMIGSTEEALHSVPDVYRQASLGLGATRWQTIRRVVLPAAMPGILTGSILGLGRAAGETAPIMFTAATFYTLQFPYSPFHEVMALPYHVYVLATAGTHIEQTRPLQYGTVLVLILLVLGLCLSAVLIRARMRRRKQW